MLLLLCISKELLHLTSRWDISLPVFMDYLVRPLPCGWTRGMIGIWIPYETTRRAFSRASVKQTNCSQNSLAEKSLTYKKYSSHINTKILGCCQKFLLWNLHANCWQQNKWEKFKNKKTIVFSPTPHDIFSMELETNCHAKKVTGIYWDKLWLCGLKP